MKRREGNPERENERTKRQRAGGEGKTEGRDKQRKEKKGLRERKKG